MARHGHDRRLTRNRVRIRGITDLPSSAPGMRIGLFGGSFDPPHDGHRLVAIEALKRLDLDVVWVLVSPGNPLKDQSDLAPLRDRVLAARRVLAHPRIRVTGVEAAHGFRFTLDTLAFLRRALPGRHPVWIMGGDSLRDFPRWRRWQDIARVMPIAVYARPVAGGRRALGQAATVLAPFRLPEGAAPRLAGKRPPAWVFLHGRMSGLSSTALRLKRATDAS